MASMWVFFLILAATDLSVLCCTTQSACSQNCRQTPKGPECYCNEGFTLGKDGKTCEGPEPILVFSTQREIRAMFLRTGRYFSVHSSVGKATSIAVDPLESRVYWVEISNKSTVYSSKLDGSDFSTVLTNGLMVPESIAVDYLAKILYISDSGLDQILACKIDGTMCHVLHSTSNYSPKAIAVDPPEGFLYWSKCDKTGSYLHRSGMDGCGIIHFTFQSGCVNAIAIDGASNRLYFSVSRYSAIVYKTLDKVTEKVLIGVNHPYSLAVFENNVYVSDNFTLASFNKFTGQNTTSMVRENGLHIMGVHVYDPVLARRASNPCRGSSCSHICLIAPLNTYRCACPPGFSLGGNRRNCTDDSNYPMLLVNDESKIYHIRPQTVGSIAFTELPLSHVDFIGRLAYDWKSKTLFVSDMKTPAIYAFNMTSQSRRQLDLNHMVSPEGLAFDPRSDNIYWTDSNKGTVEVAEATGSKHSVIVANLSKPMDIVLVPNVGKMFVSTVGQSPSVWMYDMDGKNGKVLGAVVGLPMALAVDPSAGILYWADPRMETISSIDYTNSYSSPKVEQENVGNVTSLAAGGKYLYWTDSKNHALHLVKFKEADSHIISLPGVKSGLVSRKVIYASQPKSKSYSDPDCVNLRNECSYLCLTSPIGYACACPLGMQLSQDRRSCSVDSNYPLLLVNDESKIYYIRPETAGSIAVSEWPLSHVDFIGRLAYDWKSETLFISDMKKHAIYAFNMTSQNRRQLDLNHMVSPEGLAFDPRSDNIYWTDSNKGTVEVAAATGSKHSVIVANLSKPMDIVLVPDVGKMFVSTVGQSPSLWMYDMDGKNGNVLSVTVGFPMALAVHPSAGILYWADPRMGTISSIDYTNSNSQPKIVSEKIGNVTSIAVDDKFLYWTDSKHHVLHLVNHNESHSHTISLPGSKSGLVSRKVIYASAPKSRRSFGPDCANNNGGCSFLCLTSPSGRTCACPLGMQLSQDGKSCSDKGCTSTEFKCPRSEKCIPREYVCDGTKDCPDGSDETCEEPVQKCPSGDFNCSNGRCILFSWKCDGRDDCGDNSDEIGCPPPKNCSSKQMACLNGECISALWRCDGENDCKDGSDEVDCHATTCDPETQLRCDHGQCIPISWACDGAPDCMDSTDERNCNACTSSPCQNGGRCNLDGEGFKCTCTGPWNGITCGDDACTSSPCQNGGKCLVDGVGFTCTCGRPWKGRTCTDDACTSSPCQNGGRCELDGEGFKCTCTAPWKGVTCGDDVCKSSPCQNGGICVVDGEGFKCTCTRPWKGLICEDACEGYSCPESGECISWSRVCDGKHDCGDLMDEGPLCDNSCDGGGGRCAHKCQKTPQGSKCSCHEGYILSKDGVSCDDECDTSGRCSHFCNSTEDGFKCICAEGYVLESDQRTCKVAGEEAYLAYLVKDGILGLSLQMNSRQVYISRNFVSVIGMGYDAAERTFFWADRNEKTINSYSADSAQFEVLLATQQEPLLIRRDWLTKNIYFTTDEGSIVCCNGNGRYCNSVITNVSSHISGFDVSPAFGFIFWSVSRHHDLKSVSGVIERANMDGSFREVIVSEGIFLPTAIAVDPVVETIYWCDSMLGVIESTDFYGFRRRKIVDHIKYPISMTAFENYIYWSDRATNSLSRCDKSSGKDCETLLSADAQINFLMIVHKSAQMQGENRCASNNCLHICLPTRTGFVCKCDDRNLTDTPSCERDQSCPDDYCPENAVCVVDGERFVCKCPPHFAGERCEKSLQHTGNSSNDPNPFWIVCAVLVGVCLCLLATSVLFYRRYRKSTEMLFGSKVRYVNTGSAQGSCEAAGNVGKRENEYEAVITL